ncbi:type II toxin-antitoxin system RelE/ParE family toxin [Lactococcus lactis]|uniref:type II toxin-antitoxin system RelE/ParE family toxin n=1 Tax=Lactococcus lactis TaxID=1358 RepID=UPI0024188554|nr:type II toxin-antitoxin system RelE/ParE family toxin [Lactococcus lactis]MDG4965890.1 type II toxin-antitoxin system RelE/ParE family toxin [Lactococcus lactis]
MPFILKEEFITGELKDIEVEKPNEYQKLIRELTYLEQQGYQYHGTRERELKAVKTKNYRVLYYLREHFIICLVCYKKQGQKLPKKQYDTAIKRKKISEKQFDDYFKLLK